MTDDTPTAPPQHLHGDRPITPVDRDELGFAPIAKRIAEAIEHQAAAAGLVLAIEGRWGSGKSSLVNLIAGHLQEGAGVRPAVVKFEPWLIGDRDALLSDLFADLATAVARIEDAAQSPIEDALEKGASVAERMRAFASRLGGVGKVAKFAGAAGVPGAGLLGELIEKAAEAAQAVEPQRPLVEVKAELDEALSKLSSRIVVIVDDLDRLEPNETCEIIRLVRAVANFPNVVYVLCFDPDIVAHNIQAGLNVASGRAYLEKIIQVSVSVPLPEPFDLRRWFSRELASFADCEGEVAERLARIIDVEGGLRLNTPRDVSRALNALRLVWPSLRGRVDLADLVWLQLIRVSNPSLYRWIENYLREMAAVQEGAGITEAGKRRMHDELIAALAKDELGFGEVTWSYSEILPGFKRGLVLHDDDKIPIAQPVSEIETRAFITGKRIASPQHYRLYFSLEFPAGTLTDAEFAAFLAAAADTEDKAIAAFGALVDAERPQGGSKADLAIDRLRALDRETLPRALCRHLLVAFATHLDRAALAAGRGEWGDIGIWRAVIRLLPNLLARIPGPRRKELIRRISTEGAAIGWLTRLFRDEIFSHGRYGARQRPVEERILKPAEFDIFAEAMLARYQGEPVATIRGAPVLLHILFAWRQAGDAEALADWIKRATETDEDLLATLEGMRSWQASNGRVHFPLTSDNVTPFLDLAATKARVTRMERDPGVDETLRKHAKLLLAAFEDDEL